jgi:hypothetical protein
MTPENHKKIAIDVCLPLLHKEFPYEELGYFLMGNWLTDVSQGIAPVDYAAAKQAQNISGVADAKRKSWWYRNIIPDSVLTWGANKKIKEILGDPPPKNSKMAEWFKNLVYHAGWVEFCYPGAIDSNLKSLGAGPIDFTEYDRIYAERFSQYFPHEHFDRFPMDRTELSNRGLFAYLETDIRNIADLLTRVQRDWGIYSKKTDADALKKRHDILARLGYALHTTEDYWAHTNYVDFAMRALNIPISDPNQKRKHELRLKRDIVPRITPESEPSKTIDETYVVGGYFDSIDTRFSVKQIYNYYYTKIQDSYNSAPPSMRDKLDWRKAHTAAERQECKNTHAFIQNNMNMPQKVRDAQFKYMEIDWYLKDKDIPTISEIMEGMIKDGDRYADTKFKDGSRYSERVGSHTLIAKDDVTKQPGFEEAMNVAKRVDKYIIETLLGKSGNTVSFSGSTGTPLTSVLNNTMDWLDLLQYFLWHPAPLPQFISKTSPQDEWWKEAIKNGGGSHKHLIKFVSKEERDKRAELSTRKMLEVEHNSMIKIEEVKYLAWYNSGDGESTEKVVQGLRKGEVKEYVQKDMDTGSVRIVCKKGSLKISLYAAVWYTYKFITEKQLKEGEVWVGDFAEQSSVCDQDNKAVVTALEDGTVYDIKMASYDR